MKGLGFIAVVLILGGCTISTPLKIKRPADDKKFVTVAVTNAVLHSGQERDDFYRYSRELLAILPQQEGNLGAAIRREILGHEAWTITVWESDVNLKNFLLSREHLNAMYMASGAIVRMRQVKFSVARTSKIDWQLGLAKIANVPYRTMKQPKKE